MRTVIALLVVVTTRVMTLPADINAADASPADPLIPSAMKTQAFDTLNTFESVDAMMALRKADYEKQYADVEADSKRRGILVASTCAYPIPSFIPYAVERAGRPTAYIRAALDREVQFWSPMHHQIRESLNQLEHMDDKSALLTMARLDGALREQMSKVRELARSDERIDETILFAMRAAHMCIVDLIGTHFLKSYLDRHDWPAISLAGKEADDAAWILLVHGIHDLDFQQGALDQAERYLKRGDTSRMGYARLRDRLLNMHGKPQLYGTQYECVDGKFVLSPYDDLETVKGRRRELDLEPLDMDLGPC